MLAVCGDLGCTRERLLAMLWPESDDASARHGLRDALHIIRRTWAQGRPFRRAPAAPGPGDDRFRCGPVLPSAVGGSAADAVRLYAGPLLDGFHVDDAAEFERWLDGERVRLAREYGEALKQLATAAEAAGAWGEAGGWWARAVEQDPLNSHLVLHQMRVLAAMGDRANAIRVAEGHVRRFREEFDHEPDREVLATWSGSAGGSCPPCRGRSRRQHLRRRPYHYLKAWNSPHNLCRPRDGSCEADTTLGTVGRGGRRLVLGGAFAAGHLPGRRIEARAPRSTIAVLPFRNLSEDTSYAYVARGLHDELLTSSSRWRHSG